MHGEASLEQLSLQERYAPEGICFGCGPANREGLRIRSFPEDGEVTAEWRPESRYQAFPGVLNGGIIGTLLDCHSNWTAAYHLMHRSGAERPPVTVTAEYTIRLREPTPADAPVRLTGRVVESSETRATVEAELASRGSVTATCRGVFIAVGEGHPAHEAWK